MSTSTIEKNPILEKETKKISIEYKALEKAIKNFQICLRNWDTGKLKKDLEISLDFNEKLWKIFRSDCESENCTLPDSIKNNLLSLESFINRYTKEIKKEPSTKKLDILIAINKNIASGFKNSLGLKA